MLSLFGVRRVERNEPATVARMRQLARRAGISQAQLEEAVGYSLAEWLTLNPGWSLCHLLAQAVEAHAIRTGEKREDVDQVA